MAYENINFSKPNMVMVDGYFFMFDGVNNVVIQKTASGKIVSVYPVNTELLYKYYEDDFDTNTYDSDLWTLTNNAGTLDFSNGTYRWKSASGSSSSTTLSSIFTVGGEFDARVNFNCLLYPTTNFWGAYLYAFDLDNSYYMFTVFIRYISGARRYISSYYDGSWHETSYSTTDLSGGLRLYRASSSSTTYAYYLSESSWITTGLGNDNDVLKDNNNIQIYLAMFNSSSYPQFEVEFDNFSICNSLSSIKSVQYDGKYFWTLQALDGTDEPIIRKWLFNNYECKLQEEFIFENTDYQTYDADAFAIEHYITKLTSSVSAGAIILNTEEYYDNVIDEGSILSIGPNRYDLYEDATVSGVVGSNIVLTSGVQYDYELDDQVSMSSSILLLNNYYGTSSDSGALIRMSSTDGSFMSSDPRTDYQSVIAATFARIQGLLRDNEQDIYDVVDNAYALIYVKGTNAKFRNLSDLSSVQDASSANDSFTGVSGSLPDSILWGITYGSPALYNNELLMSTVIDGHDELQSNYVIMDDFDVQISGSLDVGYSVINTQYSNFNHYISASINNVDYVLGIMYQHADANTISGCSIEYTMDSVSGTALYDTSGNENNATTYGITYDIGKVGNAAIIADKTDYILLDTAISGSMLSVSMWYYFDGTSGNWNTLLSRNEESYHHLLIQDSTNLVGFFNSVFYSSGYSFTEDNWYHIVLIKNGTTSKLYINKELKQNSDSSFDNSDYPLKIIGNYKTSGNQGSLGKLDLVRVYDGVELTVADIEILYTEGFYSTYLDSLLICSTVDGEVNDFTSITSNYLLRLVRSEGDLYYYYKSVVSGVPDTEWTLFGSESSGVYDAYLLLGLESAGITVSGAVFDDLIYNAGSIKYPTVSIPYYDIMNMDNIESDDSTVIPIYSISYYDSTLYRLQAAATYYGNDYSWSDYNYVVSTVRSFIDSITIDSYPSILPADGRQTSEISCLVLDQYGNGTINTAINFTDNDDYGYITINPQYTDYYYGDGNAITYYRSGVDEHTVTITATAVQNY